MGGSSNDHVWPFGGRGVKNFKKLATWFKDDPLSKIWQKIGKILKKNIVQIAFNPFLVSSGTRNESVTI